MQSSVEGKRQEGWDRAPPGQENLGLDKSGAGNQRPGIISLASERTGKGRRHTEPGPGLGQPQPRCQALLGLAQRPHFLGDDGARASSSLMISSVLSPNLGSWQRKCKAVAPRSASFLPRLSPYRHSLGADLNQPAPPPQASLAARPEIPGGQGSRALLIASGPAVLSCYCSGSARGRHVETRVARTTRAG